ncbi:MAG: M48 family metallopeptidase [Ignavibacteria bacterium]|nr:M48 family metallopeptidase [Ignavibacteria bacterium]
MKRSKKAKYIRMQISIAEGLEIIIPHRMNFTDAENFVLRKKDWILKHISRLNKREGFFFLGEEIAIIQNPDLTKDFYDGLIISDSKLFIKTSGIDSGRLTEIYEMWLYIRAKKYLPERIKELAGEHGFIYKSLSIRRQKSRWGSCSTRKTISLNFRLMMFEKKIIDYVIIHELCHLKEMNHSKKFWNLVQSILPDYQIHRKKLKY